MDPTDPHPPVQPPTTRSAPHGRVHPTPPKVRRWPDNVLPASAVDWNRLDQQGG